MWFYFLWMVTPVLGALRNYAKYHTVSPLLFVRTPVLTYGIYAAISQVELPRGENLVLWALIGERWAMLGLKMGLSWYKDDYHKKKDKYTAKYNLIYADVA
jgi:hypothetical protein